MAMPRTLCLVALLSALALLVSAVPEQARSEICGAAATAFDLYVTDGGGAAINDGNKAQRTEILTFSWTICPDAQVTDNFGNNRFGDYAFQRGVSDQPTGGFHWIVQRCLRPQDQRKGLPMNIIVGVVVGFVTLSVLTFLVSLLGYIGTGELLILMVVSATVAVVVARRYSPS